MKHSFTKSWLVMMIFSLAFGLSGVRPVRAAPTAAGAAMYIKANPSKDTVHVYGRASGTNITLQINRPSNGPGVDYTASAIVAQAPWDPMNPDDQVANFDLSGGVFDLQVGDIVKATVGSSTVTVTTVNLTSLRWFIGMGTGTNPEQILVEHQVMTDFNKSHATLELMLEVQAFADAYDALTQEIAEGNAPDIVGPAGWAGFDRFRGKWLDLETLASWAGYDTSIFGPNLLASQHTDEDGQVALPFAVFPSAMYYNPALFDEAGLNYPPAHYGDQYQMPNASMVDWTWDTVAAIGKLLTVDSAGRNATHPNFDRAHIVQYGFSFGWQNALRQMGSYWQSGSVLQSGGTPSNYVATIPTAWSAAWKWNYTGMWSTQRFIPNWQVKDTPEFGYGNVFNSGRVAMVESPAWYLCCVSNLVQAGGTFQLGAMPSYNGQVAGRMDADTFRIPKSSSHPEEAFTVLTYLVDTAASDLTSIYGAMSAVTTKRQEFVDRKALEFPFVTTNSWNILLAGLNYPDSPSAEAWTPEHQASYSRLSTSSIDWSMTPGLNMSYEINELKNDLESIFNTGSPLPAPSVLSIVRASPNPTDATLVNFSVTFSRSVRNVDIADFGLTTSPGIVGASITSITGGSATRTVTVNTGTGSGTIRLDVIDNNIQDVTGRLLVDVFTSGQVYSINRTLAFNSVGAQDGFVIESSENSNTGASTDSLSAFLALGDHDANRQIRSIVSFNTNSIPDNAVITGVTLKLKKSFVINGGDPMMMFQGFMIDLKNGFFGTVPTLQLMDFQAAASSTYGPFSPALVSNTYSINLTAGKASINKLSTNGGLTQIRLRFQLDDNNNGVANYLSPHSGDATNVADRPKLVITYKLP